ncbi:hypothetical protein C2E23DRAFT_855506 [Lenzites betulinus]|nr:hypothetical protein C2E23DRAFT_855506 [Lenzites betulinus]
MGPLEGSSSDPGAHTLEAAVNVASPGRHISSPNLHRLAQIVQAGLAILARNGVYLDTPHENGGTRSSNELHAGDHTLPSGGTTPQNALLNEEQTHAHLETESAQPALTLERDCHEPIYLSNSLSDAHDARTTSEMTYEDSTTPGDGASGWAARPNGRISGGEEIPIPADAHPTSEEYWNLPRRETRAHFLTRTGLLRVTNVPVDDPALEFQMNDPDDHTRYISPQKLEAFDSLPPYTACMIDLYGQGPLTEERMNEILPRVRSAIAIITGETDVRVEHPEPSRDGACWDPPTTWILWNMSPRSYYTLFQNQFWDTNLATFRMVPRYPTPPRYLFAVLNLNTKEENVIRAAILPIMLYGDGFQASYKAIAADRTPRFKSPLDGAALVAHSIRVSVIEMGGTRWRNELSELTFPFADGPIRAGSRCKLCHGVDHTTHLCPYNKTDIPGWMGKAIPAKEPKKRRTYAQVAASPPTTPKQRGTALPAPQAPHVATPYPSTNASAPSARPPHVATPGPSTINEQPRAAPSNGPTISTPPASEYHFDDMDMEAFEASLVEERRYGTPNSEDWRNLSVHGNDSVASDIVADVIGDTVISDGVDLENFITDGVDRYGDTIPGQEEKREESRAKKRPRTSGSPPANEPRTQISVRFRKHRPRAANVALPNPRPDTRRALTRRDDSPSPLPSHPVSSLGISTEGVPSADDSPPRIPSTAKGKKPEGWQSNSNHQYQPNASADTGGTPWRSLIASMDVDMAVEAVSPPNAQVEVLPSFLALPSPAHPDLRRAPWQSAVTEGPAPHITPPTPGADGYGFTPEPEGGFPAIHHAHPEGLIEDLAVSRIDEAWKQPEGAVLFVQVANMGLPDVPLRKPLHDEIYELIKHVTGETDFVPIAPQAEWTQAPKRAGAPKTWTILGLRKPTVADLVKKRVLSCVWVTLFFYDRRLVIPRYLFTLGGYTTNHENDIVLSIRGAFLDEPIFSSLADLVQSHPGLQHLAPHEAAQRIAASVEVRIDQLGNGNMQAAVFCDSPTGCGESWKIWRANLMKMPFHSRYNPTAMARRIELCAGCHSADHVTHKCPFPSIQGWCAPPAISRTYGRPRHQQNQGLGVPTHNYAPQTNTAPRGRGRGIAPYRTTRAATPARNQYSQG